MNPENTREQSPETSSTAIVESFDVTPVIPPAGTKAKPRPAGKERQPTGLSKNGESEPSSGEKQKH